MTAFRGGLNPSARLADDLTPVVDPTAGGVFCRERLDLPAGPHTVRLQVQLPLPVVAATIDLTAVTTSGRPLGQARLDTADPDALDQADTLVFSFVLEEPSEVAIEGTTSSHAALTFLRHVTHSPVPAYDGAEDGFRFFPVVEFNAAPRAVVFGTTAVCNANCFHCPTNKAYSRTQTRGVMDLALFERIVTELAETGFGGMVTFGLFGEPLQDPLFPERMRILRRWLPGVVIMPSTNAALYDPDKHREALAMADDVAVHIEGASSPVYETSMRPLKAARTFPRAEQLIRDRAGAPVRLAVPLHRRNLHEVAAIRDHWEGLGAGPTEFLPLMNRAGQGAAFDDVCLAPQATGCSPVVLNDLIIDWDGAVVACCQDFHRRVVLGDLTRESVAQVMTNLARRQMARTLNDKRWNAVETCAGCRYDRPSAIDALVSERLKDSDAERRFQPREFRMLGQVAFDGHRLRVAARRSVLARLGRPRAPAATAVIYGPYKPLHPGRYRITFDLSDVVGEIGGRILIEVCAAQTVLASQVLVGSHRRPAVEFTVDVARYLPLEFRLTVWGMSFDFHGVSSTRLESLAAVCADGRPCLPDSG